MVQMPALFITLYSPFSMVLAAAAVILLWRLLSALFRFPVALVTTLLILAGTNLTGQIFTAPLSANVILFPLYLLVILLTIQFQEGRKWLPLFLLFPGMIAIAFLGATGISMILFPVFAIFSKSHPLRLTPKTRGQLMFLGAIALVCSLLRQFAAFTDPVAVLFPGYPDGSHFLAGPVNIHRVLFSIQNGWLVYTPLVVPAIAGYWFLARDNREYFAAAFLVLVVSLADAGGIPTWFFPGRFGYPYLVETYALLSLPLGSLVQRLWNGRAKLRVILFTVSILLITLNLFQEWQFSREILRPGRMTPAWYAATFGKTRIDPHDQGLLRPCFPTTPDSIPADPPLTCKSLARFDFEQPMAECGPSQLERAAHSGKYGLLMNEQRRFSPGLKISMKDLACGDSCWLRAGGYFYYSCTPAASKVFLVITCIHMGNPYKYRVVDLSSDRFHPKQWNHVEMSYLVPFPVDTDDQLQVYFMNWGDQECFIDDFDINLCKTAP